MSQYAHYTLDQLQDELDFLDPVKHANEIRLIKEEIEKKAANQPPETERERNMYTHGLGFMYLGKRDVRKDGSYIATCFFVLLIFPVLPIKSARIHLAYDAEQMLKVHSQEFVTEQVPMHWRQVANIYAVGLLFMGICYGVYRYFLS